MAVQNILIFCFLAFILSIGMAPATTNPPPVPHGFVLGVAQGSEDAIPVLEELNIQWTRIGVSWKQLTPKVIEPSLRLVDVQGKSEQVRRLSRQVNWAPVDKRLRSLLLRGIRPIVIVGHGYFQGHAELNGKPACPDLIGREEYLAQMYWTTRATVERYDGDGLDDAPGKPLFIIETDYPGGPAMLGFSPENQAKYVRDSFQSARNAGADAYFKFHVKDRTNSRKVTITDNDVARVKWIRQCVKCRRWPLLAAWTLTHAGYIKSHFLDVLQSVEQYWGVFTPDGRGTAAFNELKSMAEMESNKP